MESIVAQVERLERENRRLKGLALLALVVLVGIGAVQKGPSTTLTGTTLYLRDAEGKPRVVVTATQATGPMLAFMDEQGVTRLRVGLVGKEARVETWDERKQLWRNLVGSQGVFPAR
jgi:hypothetical protein